MTQKRMHLLTCIFILMLTAFGYMFSWFSSVRTGVRTEGMGEQLLFLIFPFLAAVICFGVTGLWKTPVCAEGQDWAKSKAKSVFIRLLAALPFIAALSLFCRVGLYPGIPYHWIVGAALFLLVPCCLDTIFKCWEEHGKESFWLCLGASLLVTVIVFLLISNCRTPYLVLYAGVYLVLYLSMIWLSVRKKDMDLPQGVIASFAITVLVLAGVAVCLYPQAAYLMERMSAWVHPQAWWHGSDYENVRTMLSHSAAWGGYTYAPGKVGMVDYLEYYASAIPMVALFYGGWLPAIGYIVIVLLLIACIIWGYCQMHISEVSRLPVYRAIAIFWCLRYLFALLGSFTVLPLNLALPFATRTFYWEDAVLTGVFLYGLWGTYYIQWKDRLLRSAGFYYDFDEEFDEELEWFDFENFDKTDENDKDQDNFDNTSGEWEELEEYGEV